ncbi:MAG: glycine oxidase ThiO, partial [Solirubrobacterales bacterium]
MAKQHSSDVAVVGAGIVGLACAWRLAERGVSVTVVDRGVPGAGASSVAAGMLAPVGEASWGEERLLALNLESARLFGAFAGELEAAAGLPVPYRACGALHVAADRDEAEELRRHLELHRARGLESTWLTPSECRELEPGLAPGAGPGLLAVEEAEIDPRMLLAALVAACGRSGVEVISGAEVVELRVGNAVEGLLLADGRELGCPSVVAATGAWSGSGEWLPPDARPPVRPVKGEAVRLRGSAEEPVIGHIVAAERIYLVPRADGELVVGATVEERGFDVSVTASGVHELLREAYRIVPDTAELEFVEARAGLRPGTPDNAPVIGRA